MSSGVTERSKWTVRRLRYHEDIPWENLGIQAGNARSAGGSGGAEAGRGSRAARQK